MKFNWDQTGMPVSLVSRLGQRNEFSEFKTVLNDAQSHVMRPVDVESMARDLVESGGRDLVEMVRELTTDLENTRKELEAANLRYERLVADLRSRGVRFEPGRAPRKRSVEPPRPAAPESGSAPLTEWDEWDLRFRSLLG